MGHAVTVYDDLKGLELYRTNVLAKAYLRLRKRPVERHRVAHVKGLIELGNKVRPDVIIVIKGLYISFADVVALKRLGAWVVNLNHDDFFSLNDKNWSLIQRFALPAYDFVFTTREINVEEILPLNPRVEFFPFSYDPNIHRPLQIPNSEKDHWNNDVVFVGTWEEERCSLLERLVAEVPAKYAIWGAQWEKVQRNSPLLPFIRGKEVWLDDLPKAIGGAKVALAFLRKQNRDDYTQRTFEIPACNGVFLAERTQRHQEFYQESKEAEFFDPTRPEELIEKVRLLLGDDAHRESIRKAGRAALLSKRHTYRDRLDRLLQVYNESHHDRGVASSSS